MQTFEVEYMSPSSPTRCGGSSMRVDAATPADAVEAVRRAKGNVNIVAVRAVRPPSVNYAEDGLGVIGSGHAFVCEGFPYKPSNGGRSIAS